VLILGVTYRADVKETAFTSAIGLMRSLEDRGAQVTMHDPLLSEREIEGVGGRAVSLEEVEAVDAIVIQAAHEVYRSLPDSFYRKAAVVLDGRDAFDPHGKELGETVWVRIGSPPVESAETPVPSL
jgi:UDP-N-acetyl-D-mannosaminuronate dehydrogenase